MADYKVTDTELTSIANAIRTKGGTSSQLEFPTGFVSAVQAIPTGGGVIVPLSATQNGVYTPPSGTDGYAPVTVNVSGGGGGITVYSAEGDPSSSLGSVGDIYMKEIGYKKVLGIPTLSGYTTEDLEVTYSDGSEYRTYYAYKAFGNNDGAGKGGPGAFNIDVHFLNKSVKPVKIESIRNFTVAGGYLACSPLTLYGSNDGSTWDQLASLPHENPIDEEVYTDDITLPQIAYSHIRFRLYSPTGYAGIKGVNLYIADESDTDYSDVFYKTASGWKHIIDDLPKSETILN